MIKKERPILIRDISQMLGCNYITVARWNDNWELPYYKKDNQRYVLPSEFNTFMLGGMNGNKQAIRWNEAYKRTDLYKSLNA